ncbi:MAG: tyrosine-type recombinase/integrase [Syntrophobacteraceae bacterium]
MILKHFGRVAKERSGASADKDRKNLIAGWNWANRYIKGWPKENPFTETDRQSAIKYPRYVTPVADFWKIYDSVEGQDKVMLFAYLHTAARKRELFRLRWHEVDFEKSRIQLWTRKRKDGNLESDWIPMTSELREALERWEKERTFPDAQHVFLCENDLEFCPQHYGKPFSIRREWLPRLCKRAGVKPFGLHAIRHLSASILDDAGYPITIIQGILRHKSANTRQPGIFTVSVG